MEGKSGGIGCAGTLLIIFIVLKLTHLINWGWGWVLAPLWIPLLITVLVLGVILLIGRK